MSKTMPILSRGHFHAIVDWLEEHAKQYEAQHELSNDDSDAGAAYAIRKMVKELADFYPDYK
jgi:hypothetical protein